MASSSSSSQSCKYDVFLSFSFGREDTQKTFVDNLYSALKNHQICTYRNDETLPHGESHSVFKVIDESKIVVIVFSKTYADSSWCLDELTHIMNCRDERGLIVMPIFYDVDPSEVRNQKGDFRKAFAEQEAENITKAELWRKALVDVSKIAGWEINNMAEGPESQFINKFVYTILDRLLVSNSCDYDEDLVGMRVRLQELESLLDIDSVGVRMIGIWGIGGSGKTTLASSTCLQISQHYQGYCFVENIRERKSKDGLKKLQENVLSSIFKKEVKVDSVVEGKHMMKKMLCRRKVLVILDDVDDHDQLEALAGSQDWFGDGSRIIITSRDQHLLRAHGVDHIYSVPLLSDYEAIQLFNKYAYNRNNHVEDYEALSYRVVSYANGLPLAVEVLGSFLYNKSAKEWLNALARLKEKPENEIIKTLKISYDTLEVPDKEMFLDIACFFEGWNVDDAMEILEACGYHPEIGIKVLRQKAFISIVDGRVKMHDLLQEMGHNIVRGILPNNPEEHSRVWNHEEIRNLYLGDATMTNDKIETLRYDGYSSDEHHSSHFCEIVSKMKKLRLLSKTVCTDSDVDADGPSFLSNELRYIHWELYPASPFPESFRLRRLVVLHLWGSMQKEVWKGFKYLPCLKVLQLKCMWELVSTPDLDGLRCLEKLTVSSCKELIEIHPSLVNHTKLEYLSISECPKLRLFPTIVHMDNIETLEIKDCFLVDGEIPSGIGELFNLQELNLSGNDFSRLDFSLSQLTRLKLLDLSSCVNLLELPKLPSNSAILKADYCSSLTTVGDCHNNCEWLCQVSLMGGGIINDGVRLLQSMFEGKAIDNDSMFLRLKGVNVAKGFTPTIFRGRRCRLQLPDNWFGDSCGFLICAVLPNYFHWSDPARIVISDVTSSMDSEDVSVWKESDGDGDKHTFVWYVSFGSLRDTKWWDQTHEAVEFRIEDYRCCCFGSRLVSKKTESAPSETSTYSSNHYTPRLEIEDDSNSALTIALSFYAQKP